MTDAQKWRPAAGLTERTPESAPKCPLCGYTFFGLNKLRCPECGFEITNEDELAAARWLADVNAPNRRAALRRWIEFSIGAILTCVGVIVGGRSLDKRGLLDWRAYFGACALTTLILAFTSDEHGPAHRRVLYLGLFWTLILILSLI